MEENNTLDDIIRRGETQDYLLGLSKTDLKAFQESTMGDFNLQSEQVPRWEDPNSIEPPDRSNTFQKKPG